MSDVLMVVMLVVDWDDPMAIEKAYWSAACWVDPKVV